MSTYEFYPYFTGNRTYRPVFSSEEKVSKVGDFTLFYIAIAICSVVLGFMIIFNVVCCCSRYSDYWLDRHTGNRWIVSIWSTTPHSQPALDYSELKNQEELGIYIQGDGRYPKEYENRHKEVHASISQQPLTSSQEYLELHKRESDI